MSGDRPFLGMMLMLGFCVIAPFSDALAKLLTQSISIPQLLLVRFGAQALILWPLVVATGRPWRMSRRVTLLAAARTALHIVGVGMMFTALRYLPLADAIAIAFVMPFIMLLLGAVFLGETVGPRRIVACTIGFVGTLLVVQPAFDAVGWPALLPVGVAITFAFFMLVTRQIARQTDPVSLQAVAGLMAVAVLAPFFALPLPGFDWQAPTGSQWGLLGLIGLLGTMGHLLMTWSLRYAPSATLAPMQYLEIPFATFFGWLIFHDLPNGLAAVGICITVAAGLYVIWRERAGARPSVAPAPVTDPPR